MLRPPEAGKSLGDRLVAEGRARRATRDIRTLPRPLKTPPTTKASELLLESREDRV